MSFLSVRASLAMKIAVVGCCHGLLDAIYRAVPKVAELVVVCGDFQALRNLSDLDTMAVPRKYRQLGDFHRYYSGEKVAPRLTIFVGGNHECSAYLGELPYGGWVAPNIFYLGRQGAVVYRGVRIAGISGIYNETTFRKNDPVPDPPYSDATIRSVYHVRPLEFLKTYLLGDDISVFVSHDWPVDITRWGDTALLLRAKPFFRRDIETGTLGSPVNQLLMEKLVPEQWYSAHLHVRFEAVFPGRRNTEEIDIEMGEESEEGAKYGAKCEGSGNFHADAVCEGAEGPEKSGKYDRLADPEGSDASSVASASSLSPPASSSSTHFLALDKCLPNRKYIALRTLKSRSKNKSLYLDRRAIAVNKAIVGFRNQLDALSSADILAIEIRHPALYDSIVRAVELEHTLLLKQPSEAFLASNLHFKKLAAAGHVKPGFRLYPNNQTKEFCERFGLEAGERI